MGKQRVNICLPPEQWQHVKDVARRRRMSAGEFISDAVAQALANEEQGKQERWAAVERLFAVDLGPMGTPEELRELIADGGCPARRR